MTAPLGWTIPSPPEGRDAPAVLRVRMGQRLDGPAWAAAATFFGALQMTPLLVLVALRLGLPVPGGVALVTAATLGLWVLSRRHLSPAELVLGADGVAWQQGGCSRFAAYGVITAVAPEGRDVALTLRGGRRVRLSGTRADPVLQSTVVARIRAGMTAAAGEIPPTLALLDRQGRTLPVWREALRALGAGGVYRAMALSVDDLGRAMTDPRVPAERRIGAALALSAADPEARTRIRVAAEASASDTVRVALEQIARDALDEGALAAVTRGATSSAARSVAAGRGGRTGG